MNFRFVASTIVSLSSLTTNIYSQPNDQNEYMNFYFWPVLNCVSDAYQGQDSSALYNPTSFVWKYREFKLLAQLMDSSRRSVETVPAMIIFRDQFYPTGGGPSIGTADTVINGYSLDVEFSADSKDDIAPVKMYIKYASTGFGVVVEDSIDFNRDARTGILSHSITRIDDGSVKLDKYYVTCKRSI